MIIVLPDEIHFALLKHMSTPKEWQNYSEAFLHLTTDDYFWKKLIDRFPKLTRDRCQTMNWDAALTNAKFKPVNYCDDVVLVRVVRERPPVQDFFTRSPLHAAKILAKAKILLDQGTDPNAKDKYGCIPLQFVYNVEIARLLLDYGADPNLKDNKGKTPLHYVHNVDIARVLLECKADPNLKDKYGNTPLHQTEDEDIVRLFLDFGVDLHVRNDEGQTPLQYSHYSSDSIGKAKLLLERGADINAIDNEGWTLLHKESADEEVEVEVLRFLLERGADPNIRNNAGNNPSHVAVTVENAEILLEHGADPNATNNEGKTPLELIQIKEDNDAADVNYSPSLRLDYPSWRR